MKKKGLQTVWLMLVVAFLYLPILILAVYSFTKSTMIGSIRGFSVHNYVTLFTTKELTDMIIGTVFLALLVAVLSSILGTLGAIGIFYSSKKTRMSIELVNQIPVVNSDVVTGFSICVLLIVFAGIDKDTYIPLIVGHGIMYAICIFVSASQTKADGSGYVYGSIRSWLYSGKGTSYRNLSGAGTGYCGRLYDCSDLVVR